MSQLIGRLTGLRTLGERYVPTYFLAALGNGGMAVTFFIWLNFLVPHPKTPIVTFDSIVALWAKSDLIGQALLLLAMVGVALFAIRHFQSLIWNLSEFAHFRRSSAYLQLRETNGAVTLMALPLTLAMTINVLFVSGAVFVPGLWNVVEYLFPFAMTAFFAVGVLALRMFADIFGRAVANGHFDCARNNHLTQMQAAFAFAMVGVGLAAPAAMSNVKLTIGLSILGAIFYITAAVVVAVVMLMLGVRAMLTTGLAVEAGTSLWLPIPLLTLIGIAILRISHGLHNGFELHIDAPHRLLITAFFFALQLFVGLFGWSVLRRVGYFRTYLNGPSRSPATYGLICPAVGLFVFGMFFLHVGLVQNGLIEKFSPIYFVLLAALAVVQALGIVTMFRLDRRLLAAPAKALVEAESVA
ncbi:TsoY family (seleno)protein [Chloroflexus sp.]|uniref:TsoY family (seleno)protein n=1 Tax=Chloroflexus sp. TaxID=1904827 RepID=UPI003D12D94F